MQWYFQKFCIFSDKPRSWIRHVARQHYSHQLNVSKCIGRIFMKMGPTVFIKDIWCGLIKYIHREQLPTLIIGSSISSTDIGFIDLVSTCCKLSHLFTLNSLICEMWGFTRWPVIPITSLKRVAKVVSSSRSNIVLAQLLYTTVWLY